MDSVINMMNLFESVNKEFLQYESSLILSGVSERTICGALMYYLRKYIEGTELYQYHVDIEYNRNKGKIKTIVDGDERVVNITCDLIMHSRGENIEQDNLICIEMKKAYRPLTEKNKDRERLKALTKNTFSEVCSYDGSTLPEHVCRYLLGVYYEIDIKHKSIKIEYYKNGEFLKQYYLDIS